MSMSMSSFNSARARTLMGNLKQNKCKVGVLGTLTITSFLFMIINSTIATSVKTEKTDKAYKSAWQSAVFYALVAGVSVFGIGLVGFGKL